MNAEPPITGEDLTTMQRAELLALIDVLLNTIKEIAEERDAALLLNELCHFI